jgi:hydroxymethylglutaryl-CoA lyase
MKNSYPKNIKVVEVGPRDGLQNEAQYIEAKDKIIFIQELAAAGFKSVEATSFVSSKKIPQMKDADLVFKGVESLQKKGLALPCLVPNLTGLDRALALNVKEVSFFTATSNTFNLKNTNATISESLERLTELSKKALSHQVKLRAYVSTVFGCPYEGETSIQVLTDLCQKILEAGAYEISLGDTIGVGNPDQVKRILDQLLKHVPGSKLALHFHDTRGLALANIYSSLDYGISVFDSSAGGLGGCPYAKGASGNVATEDLLYLFDSLKIDTGIDIEKVYQASKKILKLLNKSSTSKVVQYMDRREK